MRQPNLEAALTQWARVVGREHLITDAAPLRAAETTTFAVSHRIPAIVRPANRQDVQECLRIATRWEVPMYPISTGKNWGYGSRVPTADGSVLLDLGRMNRILDYNEELAYVTVEPGVTQAQLFEFLRERHSRLWMDCTGASPDCSLIGNTMDRGFGHTPYGDHFAHSCGLEVVLPWGDVIETGFARFADAATAALHRWGVGPTLDGLFSQSNLGVVTRMTIWLMPQPEYFQTYYFLCESEEDLPGVIDALRPLRLDGTLRSASHIANDYKVLSALEQYPWEAANGQTPLDEKVMMRLRKELKIGAWNGSGALYGTRAQVKEARRLLRRALDGKAARLRFMDDRMLRIASRFGKPYEWISGLKLQRILAMLKPVYGLMKGIPTGHPLASTYWRKRTPPPADMDPDRDGCGLLWCSPVVPNDGQHARKLTRLASDIMLRHGFEPAISLTILADRSIVCIISLTYDRDLPEEDERAHRCHQEMLDVFTREGYHSYRLAVTSMAAMGEGGVYHELLRRIKHALDPADILAPGRYVPAGAPNPSQTKTAS